MNESLERLLSLAGDPVSTDIAAADLSRMPAASGTRGQELLRLLAIKNGFYAFEAALLVRPLDFEAHPAGALQWNGSELWKSAYRVPLSNAFFFGEDLFGVQFCIRDEAINSFDPETGEFKVVASTVPSWAEWLLMDAKQTTGWPLGHFWQLRNGPLKKGCRLLPRIPFVLGGEFTVENLYELPDAEGMRFRGSIANQLAECPDGSKVVLNVKRERRSTKETDSGHGSEG